MNEHFDDDLDGDLTPEQEPEGAGQQFDEDPGIADMPPAPTPDPVALPDLTSAGIPEPDTLWEEGDLESWLGPVIDDGDVHGHQTMPTGPADVVVSAALHDVPPPTEGGASTERMIADVVDMRARGDSLDRP